MCAQINDSRYYYHTSSGEADFGGGICFAVKRKRENTPQPILYQEKRGRKDPLVRRSKK